MRFGLPYALLISLFLWPAFARADSAHAQASRSYAVGIRLYNVSEWKSALEKFKEAYLLQPDPVLLFNIGQCQRQLGDYEGAEKSYRAFLRETTEVSPAQQEQVRNLIAQMEAAVREQRAKIPPTGTQPPPTPDKSPAVVAVSTPPAPPIPVKKPVYKHWWFWTAIGGGVAVVAIGLGVGLGTSSREQFPNPGPTDASFRF